MRRCRHLATALDVELDAQAPLPASSAARSSLPQVTGQPQPMRPQAPPEPAAIPSVRPIAQMPPIPQPAEQAQPPSDSAAASAASTAAAATTPVLAEPDLSAFASSSGQPNAPASPAQAWLEQIKAQLQRYKSYPRSAVKKQQQDTVMLQFTVNPGGRVLSAKVDSPRHYRVLESEVREMLRLAGPLPSPPQQLHVEQFVWRIPVDFYLTEGKPAPVLASCVKSADPGPAPTGAAATLEQMRAYRQRLNQYLGAAGNYINCLDRGTEAAARPSRSAAVAQVQALVGRFNAQAHAFEVAQAQRAQQAQQAAAARLAQAKAAAARAYAACAAPRRAATSA